MARTVPPELLDSIAVIGMTGRFPGARTLEEFWGNLAAGVESISFFSDAELTGVPPALLKHPQFVKAKGVLDDIEWFDAGFFGYTPPEARAMDPQHRLFLEAGWTALENAGYDPSTYLGSIGVYAGLSLNTYLLANLQANPEVATSLGVDKDFAATRLSYKLNLRGPSMAVQTACSTSLVAICQACQSLLSYQCDIALAGGVSASVPNKAGYWYQEGGILSPDGHCRAFDAAAKGTVAGAGLGIVVLKRLPEAVKDGDVIHAVIRGFAVNNDGSLKIGYTAPSVQGQAQVIAGAQALAGVDPETITYIEAHGTGTELGDPIEMAALSQVFRSATARRGFCAVGSVKTNIGHLDTAAGVAGLIKTVLALEHRQIPPSLHFEAPNPKIDFAESPFFVNTRLADWSPDGPRRAGVSSFGIGGTNAHVVLEEAPEREASSRSERWQLLTISARSEAALDAATAKLREHLTAAPDLNLADAAYTLQVGRRKFPHARVLVARSVDEVLVALDAGDRSRLIGRAHEAAGQQPVVFMFPGQGAQYPGMGRDLYATEPVFRQHVDACCERLAPGLGFDLREILYPPAGGAESAAEKLQETLTTQCALFTVEYALAQLWMAWGIRPHAMVGHSVGEYVAAVLSDVLSLDDALQLLLVRGSLMQTAPAGAMVAVPLAEKRVRELLTENLAIAAVNAPSQCVVAGAVDEVEAFEARLRDEAVTYQRLPTAGAFHSPLMAAVAAPLAAAAAGVRTGVPRIPYVSNVTGDWIGESDLRDREYWSRHVRGTVRFAASVETLLTWGAAIFLEVGPGQALGSLVRQCAKARQPEAADVEVVPSLPSARESAAAGEYVVRALGRLWLSGLRPDWSAYYAHERRLRVELPTYPFERKRYWAEPSEPAVPSALDAQPRPARAALDDWFAMPSWTRTQPPVLRDDEPSGGGCWLAFVDGSSIGEQLADRLAHRGHDVVRVRPGDGFAQTSEDAFAIDPASPAAYGQLLEALRAADRQPGEILHLWGLTGRPGPDGLADEASVLNSYERGFQSLLFLAQAWGDAVSASALRIIVVSDPLQDVTGADATYPEKATVVGPVRVIPQEYPLVSCRLIDVAVTPAFMTRTIEHLVAEIESDASDPVVAYRGIDRWIPSVEPLTLSEPTDLPRLLRDGGVYLITGGYGAIGLEIARYLAAELHAKLVLVGRTGLPARELWQKHVALHGREDEVSRRIRAVQALEESGAEVLAGRADVASLIQMREVVASARARFGRIDGVFHAAGVAGGGMVQLRTPEAVAAVMRPKLAGTRVLEAVLGDDRPDFMVLCSSLNAMTGGVGQADYCAANTYLDAFARFQTARTTTFTLSVSWDTWREAGMAVDAHLPGDLAAARDRALERGLSAAEGIAVLRRCLSSTVPQVLVSTSGWSRHHGALGAGVQDPPEAASADDGTSSSAPLNPRPNLVSAYVAPGDEVQRRIGDVWCEALGVQQVGMDDSFFDLGGHSLLAVQVIARLNADFGTAIPVAKLYEGLTPAFLAELVREAKLDPLAEPGDPGEQRERSERQKRQKQHQEKRRVARTGQGRLVQ